MNTFVLTLMSLIALALSFSVQAKSVKTIETSDTEVEVRVFEADGDSLLLGFPCDEGSNLTEEKTAMSLAEDGVEVWMPDFLTAYMLPNLRSSLNELPDESLLAVIDAAVATGKKVYLISSGPYARLLLRAAADWEKTHPSTLAGAILIFPRLFKGEPEPGKLPQYVDAVGATKLPIMLLEGGHTPNRWGLAPLRQALQKGGSKVITKIIPQIRGHLFTGKDKNRTEEVVTSQMAGLIKVSIFYIQEYEQ
jgi:putative intracellular protease/amidase